MQTKIYKIDENNIDYDRLKELADLIKDGGLLAIPTETVYGLACNGLDKKAIERVFKAKNRPMDNPLILHISKMDELDRLTVGLKEEDREILKKLWPGPLTVVLKKSDLVPMEISGGLDSVAIRMPKKKITRELIGLCDLPLAAPSANLSTKPSPTNARDVLEDMDGRIEAILDGGDCGIGLESTVVDLTGEKKTILRPGYYTREFLDKYWPGIGLDLALKDSKEVPRAPGQKYKHYAPKARVEVYIGNGEEFSKLVEKRLEDKKKKIGLMHFQEDRVPKGVDMVINMGSKSQLDDMGKVLFTALREMDHKGIDLVLVHGVEEEGYGLTIMNRLKKSASGRVYNIGGKN